MSFHKLKNKPPGKHGLETEGWTEKRNPNFANRPNNEAPLPQRQAAPPRGVELATRQHIHQISPPRSSAEQTDPMDDIATIFNDLLLSVKTFAGALRCDFKHFLGRDRASSSPARGSED